MGLENGIVQEQRKVCRPQVIEAIGSPHWTISATERFSTLVDQRSSVNGLNLTGSPGFRPR
jgi:hypothetical protein